VLHKGIKSKIEGYTASAVDDLQKQCNDAQSNLEGNYNNCIAS